MSRDRRSRLRAKLVWASLVAAGAIAGAENGCVFVHDLGSTGTDDVTSEGGLDGAEGADVDGDASGEDGGLDGSEALDGEGPPGDGALFGGPLGALPAGYCCTRDSECRFRKCVAVAGGQRMCLDACSASRPFVCDRPGVDFSCVAAPGGGMRCEPPTGFTCLDPATFVVGTKTTGACCAVSDDGLFGQECQGNLCISLGAYPYVCTRHCDAGTDCPGNYRCVDVADRKECVPNGTPYTCTP